MKFEGAFTVLEINPDGQKFERGISWYFLVSRCVSQNIDNMHKCVFDFHKELLSLNKNDRFQVRLSRNSENVNEWEYVMQGRIFNIDISSCTISISFGGLLFKLEANPGFFANVSVGTDLVFYLRKLDGVSK